MSTQSESPAMQTILVEPYDVLLIAKVAQAVRFLRPLQINPKYRTAAQQIYEFGEAVIDAFAAHSAADERALVEMLYTDSVDCYHVEIPTMTLVNLVPALKIFADDDQEPFDNLLYIALMRWEVNENLSSK